MKCILTAVLLALAVPALAHYDDDDDRWRGRH